MKKLVVILLACAFVAVSFSFNHGATMRLSTKHHLCSSCDVSSAKH